MKARLRILFFSFILTNLNSYSQVVNENVDFDNYVSPANNDLVNHFYGMQSLTMIPANGITGGSLLTTDSNNWGNDNSIYCSKYSVIHIPIYSTGISFYYDTALISLAGYDRAVSIWLRPHADPNHYIIASVSHNAEIIVYTYGLIVISAQPMALQSGHWYNLLLNFNLPLTPNPYYVSFKSKVEDLGPSGTSNPVTIDSVASSMLDTVFTTDSSIEVSITGSRFGGSQYLDNFTFSGIKSADSCFITTNDQNINSKKEIKIISVGEILIAEGDNLINKEAEIFDLNGRKVFSTIFSSNKNFMNISNLIPGIYFISIHDSIKNSIIKFSVIR